MSAATGSQATSSRCPTGSTSGGSSPAGLRRRARAIPRRPDPPRPLPRPLVPLVPGPGGRAGDARGDGPARARRPALPLDRAEGDGWRVRFEARATGRSARSRRAERRSAHAPDLLCARAQRTPWQLRPQEALAHEPAHEHEPPSSSSVPGSSAARRTASSARARTRARRATRPGNRAAALEDECRRLEVDDHRRRAARAACRGRGRAAARSCVELTVREPPAARRRTGRAMRGATAPARAARRALEQPVRRRPAVERRQRGRTRGRRRSVVRARRRAR